MKVTLFEYVILISIGFLRFYLSVFSLVFVAMEKIYQSLKTVFGHCASYFQFSSGCFQLLSSKRSFVFKILLCTLLKTKTDFLQRFKLHSYMVTQERCFNALKD